MGRLRSGQPGVVHVVPVGVRLLSDQLTPVLAYRRLVAPDERTAPSFLLESVVGGDRQGRHSLLGAHPVIEVLARRDEFTVTDHRTGETQTTTERDPLHAIKALTSGMVFHRPDEAPLPSCVLGGWFGYAAYDTVRYAEPSKLGFEDAPPDDRDLPELHFGHYDRVVVFDHVDKLVHVVRLVAVGVGDDPGALYDGALADLDALVWQLETHSKPLPAGRVEPSAPGADRAPMASNMTEAQHAQMVERAKEYIRAGDIFQVVVGQRFERRSPADPFDVYRALRAVNPSPYMVYLQAAGCILIASSPEILCRCRRGADGSLVVTNRPLAGTRRRGETGAEDLAMERELLADEKERAEHVMLVDLGRNDVGRVSDLGSVRLVRTMEVERYSHVMHISSTVTGELREGADAWDALKAALPVGTVSGAPKVRAMQIIDELEPVRRGPYGGGLGYVGLDGQMDIALALRTIVVPTALHDPATGDWVYHIQAGGGIVYDSQPRLEYQETVNKAAALARAIGLAESALTG
ncbi:MAG: anthranilate synthase component I [Phycisphaeraceae bacterium]|nr:anthranilate synthase component I [Phycisphaeraceae bacterium]MCB9848864.1 anthranilate synthase component I [Phycisphaeraceae bacterium]